MYFYYSPNVKNIIRDFGYDHGHGYPIPYNLNYFWNFGSLSGLVLVGQIITGILLSMHYSPSDAFNSVEHIMRDVYGGWLLRYMHANGASMFFVVIYIHIGRGLFYNSFNYTLRYVWLTGMLLFLLTMGTGFLGYVLPWGQMSFWGATVITNLISAIPVIGQDVVYWLWGGFSVNSATLNRFYSLHFVLPFLIVGLTLAHLGQLHEAGSSTPANPTGYRYLNEVYVPIYPYIYIKDSIGLLVFMLIYSFFLFFAPNYLGHSDNYIEANPLVTPEHIVPEWYFWSVIVLKIIGFIYC